MGKADNAVHQPAPHIAPPTDSTGSGYPVQPGQPYVGAPSGNLAAGYPVQPGVVLMPLAVGPESCTVVCPACHQTVWTDVKVVSTSKTHLAAVLLAVIGCCLCCWIPYCMDGWRAKNHYCPNCKAFIGTYDR